VSVTVAVGPDSYIVARIGYFNNTPARVITSVTYAGTPLTLHASEGVSTDVAGIWGLPAPAVGTANLVVTFDGAFDGAASNSTAIFVDVCDNADPDSPFSVATDDQTTATPSLAFTGLIVGDMLLAIDKYFSATPGVTATTPDTEDAEFDGSDDDNYLAASTTATGTSDTVSWVLSASAGSQLVGMSLRELAPAGALPFRATLGAQRVM
jgi:hypothetical protein